MPKSGQAGQWVKLGAGPGKCGEATQRRLRESQDDGLGLAGIGQSVFYILVELGDWEVEVTGDGDGGFVFLKTF